MSILSLKELAVPFGSLIVVSGVSGFIGSHVADQLLAAGYRVRGTTRSISKNGWVAEYFTKNYGPDRFELFEVPDMSADNAFDKVASGSAGFCHVANDMSGSTDPNFRISNTVNGALNALKAASKAGMKRFVYTSSSFAATMPKPGKVFTVTASTFNNEAVERAWQPEPDGETVYSAGKVGAERAIQRWRNENNPTLIINTILPNANIGPLLSSANQGYPTSARWVKALWESDYGSLKGFQAQHFVNVQDDARLHVIALVNPAVQGERIFAINAPVHLNDIIGVLRKLCPERSWEDFPDKGKDLSIVEPIQRAEDLLKEAYGKGFIGLDESVKANAADLIK